MPKHYRLTVSDLKSFRPVRRLSGMYFSLGIGSGAGVKAAIVVSKKVSARAVDRNRVKRRARAILSGALAPLPPASYVFYAKKDAVGASFDEVKRDIMKMLARA